MTNLKVEPQVLVPQVEVRLRPEAAERYGLTAGHVRRAATTLLKGTKVGEVYEEQKKFDVVVWGVPTVRTDLAARAGICRSTRRRAGRCGSATWPTSRIVPDAERDQARGRLAPARRHLQRRGPRPRRGRPRDRRARCKAAAVRPRVSPRVPRRIRRPAGIDAASSIALAALALVGIVLLLYVDFQAWRLTLLVAFTIPFALIGGVVGGACSPAASCRSARWSASSRCSASPPATASCWSATTATWKTRKASRSASALVLRGAEERLAPILMTALATGLALLPLVIAGNKPGHEIEYPLAVVILGGLVTSTLLNLFLLPPLYARFGQSAANCPLKSKPEVMLHIIRV